MVSNGEQTDSAGHQIDSAGTRSSTRTPSRVSPEAREERGDGTDREAPDYAKSLAKAAAQKRRDERNRAPGTWMPGSEDLDRDPQPGDDTDWERLLEAARLYGVRPTTMARMMIVRGTNAICDAELRARARELTETGSE